MSQLPEGQAGRPCPVDAPEKGRIRMGARDTLTDTLSSGKTAVLVPSGGRCVRQTNKGVGSLPFFVKTLTFPQGFRRGIRHSYDRFGSFS